VYCWPRPIWPANAQLYLQAVIDRPASKVVAICDLNAGRRAVYNEILRDAGQPTAREYEAADFLKMLDTEKLDALVVTTIDHTHDEFIVPALKRGIRVLTEKPMTT
jgi:predicted dehydrogenase